MSTRKPKEPIHVISLGAGVQSSTMALMASAGEITPMPVGAIFADTKAEPASVYRWLDWLEPRLAFPVYRVVKDNGLIEDALRVRQRRDGQGSWVPSGIPHYSLNADGTLGHGPRQCTHDFKLLPIQRQVRVLMKLHKTNRAIQWIGISLDEAQRMKPSRTHFTVHRWPLIDLGMKRADCLRWMAARGFPQPPRSACVFCPYHSDAEWRRLKLDEPAEFQKAVLFERDYQRARAQTVSKKGFTPYLHAKRVNLDQVDFSTDVERGQGLLWGNECEGLCGV